MKAQATFIRRIRRNMKGAGKVVICLATHVNMLMPPLREDQFCAPIEPSLPPVLARVLAADMGDIRAAGYRYMQVVAATINREDATAAGLINAWMNEATRRPGGVEYALLLPALGGILTMRMIHGAQPVLIRALDPDTLTDLKGEA